MNNWNQRYRIFLSILVMLQLFIFDVQSDTTLYPKETFTAAVFEHIPITGSLRLDRMEAKIIIHRNMDIYERQVEKAAKQV